MGKRKASMAVKCMDQMPTAMAMEPPVSQAAKGQPLLAVTRPTRSSAAKEAATAITS